MNRKEFRISFSQAVAEDDHPLFDIAKGQGDHIYCDLSNEGLDTLTNIAEVAAEPLFEEIERLKEERDTAVGERILYANKVLYLEAQLLWWKQQHIQSTKDEQL